MPSPVGTLRRRCFASADRKCSDWRTIWIDEIRTKDPDAIKSAADVWFICALAERDPATAEAALAALGDGRLFTDNATSFNADFGRALVARMMKDESKARSAFAALRADQEKIVQAQPDYGPPVC